MEGHRAGAKGVCSMLARRDGLVEMKERKGKTLRGHRNIKMKGRPMETNIEFARLMMMTHG
jgi:hypothetical protein